MELDHTLEIDNSSTIDRNLSLNDFDYVLPNELIAQTPLEPRDSSRLLVVQRASDALTHRHFYDIGDYLRPGDLLIANQSRVIPARLLGRRTETGGAVEVLLLVQRTDLGHDYWEALVRPGRRLREGALIEFTDAEQQVRLVGEIQQRTEAGGRIVHFSLPVPERDNRVEGDDPYALLTVRQRIDELGRMPLPPYIHQRLDDPERYQTVYARIQGSAAAPTAGLHFTERLLAQLREKGVRVGFVTLHVGLDTFRPVEHEHVAEHKMHSEEIELDSATAELITSTRQAGGRIVAVGTTSVRVLESVASLFDGEIRAYQGRTRLFITPGYQFKVVDAMITNFHLPRSTLLLLVSAFTGKALMERVYAEAIEQKYRFFSFGDAMLLL